MNGRVHIIPVYKDTDFSYQRYMCDRGDTTFMLDHLEYLLNNVYAPQYNKLNKEYEHLEVKRKRAEKGVQQKRHPNLSDVNAQIEAEMAVMDKLVELGVVKGEIDILTRLIQENSQPYIQTNRQ